MDVGLQHPRCIGNPGGQLQIGARTVADMYPAVPQNHFLLVIQPYTMRENQAVIRQPQMIKVDDIAHAGHCLNNLDLSQILRSMGMHLNSIAG